MPWAPERPTAIAQFALESLQLLMVVRLDDYDYDLGSYSRPITTTWPKAQRWFDHGLLWCYGFNHEEAARCFQRALAADPACAMAHWGLAYAHGSFYNKPWEFFGPDELPEAVRRCCQHAQQTLTLATSASPAEQGLINALTHRFPGPEVVSRAGFNAWDALIVAPLPADPDLYLVTTAMTHYAKGLAQAALGRGDPALSGAGPGPG